MTSSRGRPARTSREEIINAACAQLKKNPFSELSLSALARSMALTPMALYRYFEDKNDLQQAIAERLMAAISVDFDGCSSWQTKVQRWASTMWRVFHENPQLIRYMGWRGHVAGAWIRQVALLAGALREAGLTSRNLATTLKWITFSVVGIIHIAVMRTHQHVQLKDTDIKFDDALAIATIGPIMQDLGELSELDVFEYHVTQLIARIEAMPEVMSVTTQTC